MASSSPQLISDYPATTTISTIAVQSGVTRIVIALLQSKEWIQLKIQEMQPSMTDIGSNLEEVTQLYQQHEKVLEKLQTKQSPVEELLRQADDLISTQKPRGEVYSAMAENLGLAWRDLNAQLEQRRQILEQAVAFFSKAEQFSDAMEVIKKSISDPFLPETAEATNTLLNRHKEERKMALSSSMRMLSEGQLLLEKLCEVATHSMGDSRPLHMQPAARQTSSFVERHIENLQDKWRHLDSLWTQRKTKLEQCLLKCQIALQMDEMQEWLQTKGATYLGQNNLGDSLASSEILHHENQKAEKEAKEKQEQCLKLVKSTEDLCQQGHYMGDELKNRAYLLLSECSELVSTMDHRRQLLADAVSFFNKAQTAQTKLDQIEIQLSARDAAPMAVAIEDVVKDALTVGRQILNTVGIHDSGVQGISRKMDELQRKKNQLCDLCKAKETVLSEKNQAFKKFCEKYDELMRWLNNNCQFFIQRTRDMGTTQTAAKAFIDQHENLQNDLRMKGMETDALIGTVASLIRSGGQEAQEVHNKSDTLRQQWSELKIVLEKRIRIGHPYYSFHKLASKVSKEIDEFEKLIKATIESPNQNSIRTVEENQITLKQEILQLNNSGKNFLADAQKVDEPYLNMTQPIATVEDILNRIEMRTVALNTQWLNFQNQMSATKETVIKWEQLIKDSQRVIKNAKELESKIFPVIPRELYRVESILPFLENRMSILSPQIKSVQKDLETFLKKSENLDPKDSPRLEGQRVVREVQSVNQAFQKKLTDYQILLSMMNAFFKNFEELEKLVDMQESQFRVATLPTDVTKLETLMHDHESNKPTVLELFKFNHTEAEQLVRKINESEPPEAAALDREKIYSIHNSRKQDFEKAWDNYKHRLEQHNQLCAFNRDMQLINQQIEELNSQLSAIRNSFGESLSSARHTSEAFYRFEKTIELLQIRIREFISTAEKMMREQKVDSVKVNREIDTMQKKWSTFQTQVESNRKLIDVAIEYYKTIEEAEEWLREGSRLLISVARKSSTCTTETDASKLKREVEDFLNKGRHQQEQRLKKISSLSAQLYGDRSPPPATQQMTSKNKDMLDSFTVISTELTTLTTNLRVSREVKKVEQKGKEEMDAVLHAAQAEAETAKAAAAAALQAAKVAEAAAKAIPSEPPQRPPIFVRPLVDAEVTEGTKFIFECQVDGEPTPQVQWFKDNILVENNPDYQTTFDKGVCRLIIEETFSEDTAKFSCKAVNPAGTAETYCHLVVKESRSQNELIPPHFVQEPKDAIVPEGQPHQMECHVFGNPLPLVSWFKDDINIDYSTDYSITYNNGYCTLKIEESCLDHQGRYTCRAVNPVGQIACSANLTVSSSVPTEKPIFITPLSNVMARAGQKLRLECSVVGQPEPQITWLHNSKAIKETRDTKLHFDGRNATLIITEAFPKDAGTYTVVAKNKAGEAISTSHVSVKGRLPLETSDSEMASDIEPAKPQVKQHLVDQTVKEGNKVRMDCVIVGQPEPEVIWYHNGKPVKESDDFQLLFEGDRCTLVIKMAYLEDAGSYKCVAINSGGEASSICTLKVEPAAEIVEKSTLISQKDILLMVEKHEPPKFIKLLQSIVAMEGQDVILHCQISGAPGTTVTWYKDGVEIFSTPEHKITSDEKGNWTLVMPSVRCSDCGAYSVRAQNKGGEAQSFCTVSVAPMQIEQGEPPLFLKHVDSLRLVPGGSGRFETVVRGVPKPELRWNFQGKPVLQDLHHEMGSEGNKYWLIIKNANQSHAGRYAAVAENDSGIATTSALLSLEEQAIPQPEASTQEQIAQPMIMTKKKTIMQTSTISSMSEVSDAEFQPEEFPSYAVLENLSEKKQTVSIKETISRSPPQSMQTLKPPKFLKPVSTAVVIEGEKLLLEAQYEGIPEPKVQWLKDDAELKSGTKLQITTAGDGRTSLFIMKSVENDTGKYSCVISNDAGKAISMAEVRVKPYREAPKFKKKLEAGVVKSGNRVTFEVEVTGIPEPQIKWYRNGNPIQDSPDFRISSSGNKHTLVIIEVFPEDSGNFMVIASNPAGEARSMADLIVEEEKSPEEEKHISYQEFSSVQQKTEMFTKISMSQPSPLEPYKTLPTPETPAAIEPAPTKVPSPPPLPAIAPKIWSQPKPEPFPAPAITETQEPVPVLEPEEPEKIETTLVKEVVQEPPKEQVKVLSNVPSTVAMTESFVKQSVMKFSQPEMKQVKRVEDTRVRTFQKSHIPQPIVQNGIDKEPDSVSTMMHSSIVTESRSMVTSGSGHVFKPTESSKTFPPWKPSQEKQVTTSWQSVQSVAVQDKPQSSPSAWKPKTTTSLPSPVKYEVPKVTEIVKKDVSKTEIPPVWKPEKTPQKELISKTPASTPVPPQKDKEKSEIPVAVWKPKQQAELKSTWRPVQPQKIPICDESQSKVTQTSVSSSSETKSTSTISSQTSTGPFSSTETSTTRTSYSTEQISITKKYEMVFEHTMESTMDSVPPKSTDSPVPPPEATKAPPKPCIKKDTKDAPRAKKEVVIEEEPVVSAEVKPPLFSKVRGADSLKKIEGYLDFDKLIDQ